MPASLRSDYPLDPTVLYLPVSLHKGAAFTGIRIPQEEV
jgi:hypothetical protein